MNLDLVERFCNRNFSQRVSAVDVVPHYDVDHELKGVCVTRIHVPRHLRGSGYGSHALDNLCIWADMYSIPLYLVPAPGDDMGLTFEQLLDWYGSRGWDRKEGGYFVRRPKEG